jgi:hypothetical protein
MSFAGGLFQALYITKVVCIGGCNSLKIFHICTVSREPPQKKTTCSQGYTISPSCMSQKVRGRKASDIGTPPTTAQTGTPDIGNSRTSLRRIRATDLFVTKLAVVT